MTGNAAPSRSRAAALLLLVGLAALVLVIALRLRDTRVQVEAAVAALAELESSVEAHRAGTEDLVQKLSQARIEKAEERERADGLEERLAAATAALVKARADLARVGMKRDEHLRVRLELEARLEAALGEMAK